MPSSTEISQVVTLELLGPCNYLCWYCVGDRTTTAFPEPVLHSLPKLVQIYASLRERGPVRTTTYARGTEPALHPQIRQIVDFCAAIGPIHILTNLSIPVTEWLPSSTNCTLRATIHPEAEEDIDGFFDRLREAQKLGYQLLVGFDSRRIEETDYGERLADMGINLMPHRMRAPDSKTKKAGATSALRAAGLPCAAGYDRFFIRATSILWRCTRDRGPLPAPLPAPGPCALSATCGSWKEPR